MKKIGVLANRKRDVGAVRDEIISYIESKGAVAVAPDGDYDVVDQRFLRAFMEGEARDCECLIVLGGDGTLLSVARQAAYFSIPIFGINLGHLGFLSEVDPGDGLYVAIDRILRGDFTLEERMMLYVRVFRGEKLYREYHCLNDCVLTKRLFEGLVHIDAFVDDKVSLSYNGDGLIVATPTGASGYSLSAGGPLVSPEMEAMILTPVSAHSLYSRSIVIGADRDVMLRADKKDGRCVLSIDGKTSTLTISEKDSVRISKSSLKTTFLRLNDRSFFHVLNEKLRDRS
ncbi:MAG: NAD(+)/NADH kinase [Bacillota bacterium]|jgi:NAD+ kinase